MKSVFIALSVLLALPAFATTIEIGKPLPKLSIEEHGELLLSDDEFSYQPWESRSAGMPQVLQYLAGRASAQKQSKPFTDRLQEELPYGSYNVTTIVNLDDALWGTSAFVASEVRSSKREHPASTIVLDEDGLGQETWQLEKGGAAIVLLDSDGEVLFIKQGGMSEEEILAAADLIRQQLPKTES